MLSSSPAFPYLTWTASHDVGSLVIPISQTRRPKLREVKSFPQGHTAGECELDSVPLAITEGRPFNRMPAEQCHQLVPKESKVHFPGHLNIHGFLELLFLHVVASHFIPQVTAGSYTDVPLACAQDTHSSPSPPRQGRSPQGSPRPQKCSWVLLD